MAITPHEIINTIKTLPVSVQEEIVKTLQKDLEKKIPTENLTEDEIEQILLAKGVISEIPKRISDAEEETFDPIEVEGKTLSATILEDRE